MIIPFVRGFHGRILENKKSKQGRMLVSGHQENVNMESIDFFDGFFTPGHPLSRFCRQGLAVVEGMEGNEEATARETGNVEKQVVIHHQAAAMVDGDEILIFI